MTLLPMPKREKTEEEKELERLERLDHLISDANPRISIERKRKIAELKEKFGKKDSFEIPNIFPKKRTTVKESEMDSDAVSRLEKLLKEGTKGGKRTQRKGDRNGR